MVNNNALRQTGRRRKAEKWGGGMVEGRLRRKGREGEREGEKRVEE